MPSPLSGQDSSPRCSFPRHHRQRRPGGGSRGTGHDTTWLGLRHLKGRPGALQGHQPRANSARTPNGGRRVRRDSGTPPPRRGEGRLARRSREGYSAESVRSVRETTGVNNRGQAGFRTPLPSLPHTATGRGRGERRGARGQSEKSDPIRQGMSVPRLARLRPGPGERNVTTSIKRRQKQQGKRGEHSRPKRACGSAFFFFFKALPPPFFLRQRYGPHGPRGQGPRRNGFSPRAAGKGVVWGVCQASGRGPRSSRGQTPHRPTTQGQRVHTNLVVQNANLGQNMDCAR